MGFRKFRRQPPTCVIRVRRRASDGLLGIFLNDFNTITKLEESAVDDGLRLLDSVVAVDGMHLQGQKLDAVMVSVRARPPALAHHTPSRHPRAH